MGSPLPSVGLAGGWERDSLVEHSVGIPLAPLAPYRSLLPRAAQVPKGGTGTFLGPARPPRHVRTSTHVPAESRG